MKVYHEIFAEPDGSWHIRIYSHDRVVYEEMGKARNRGQARSQAIKAVKAYKGDVKPRWRFW